MGINHCTDLESLQFILERKSGGLWESSLQVKRKVKLVNCYDGMTGWKIVIRYIV